jgi:gas vesicle protein
MAKNNITRYLLIGGAIYAAYYMLLKPQQIKGLGNVIDTIKAKKKVSKMSDKQVVQEISTIFAYEMQDNDVTENEIYENIKEARKQLVKHYQEIL